MVLRVKRDPASTSSASVSVTGVSQSLPYWKPNRQTCLGRWEARDCQAHAIEQSKPLEQSNSENARNHLDKRKTKIKKFTLLQELIPVKCFIILDFFFSFYLGQRGGITNYCWDTMHIYTNTHNHETKLRWGHPGVYVRTHTVDTDLFYKPRTKHLKLPQPPRPMPPTHTSNPYIFSHLSFSATTTQGV